MLQIIHSGASTGAVHYFECCASPAHAASHVLKNTMIEIGTDEATEPPPPGFTCKGGVCGGEGLVYDRNSCRLDCVWV